MLAPELWKSVGWGTRITLFVYRVTSVVVWPLAIFFILVSPEVICSITL